MRLRYDAAMSLAYPHVIGVSAAEQIAFIKSSLGLSDAELGRLFAVTRQAVAGWSKAGVPAERTASVDRLVELAQILQRRLVPSRIPQIVRTQAKGLGGRTMLEVIAHDGVGPIHAYLADLAAYANA